MLFWTEAVSRTEKLALSSFQEAKSPALPVLLTCYLFGDTENSTKAPRLHPSKFESFQWEPPGWASLPAADNPTELLSPPSCPVTIPNPLSRHQHPREEPSSKREPEPEESSLQRHWLCAPLPRWPVS